MRISTRSSPRRTSKSGTGPRSRETTSWVAASTKSPVRECSMRMSRSVRTVKRAPSAVTTASGRAGAGRSPAGAGDSGEVMDQPLTAAAAAPAMKRFWKMR